MVYRFVLKYHFNKRSYFNCHKYSRKHCHKKICCRSYKNILMNITLAKRFNNQIDKTEDMDDLINFLEEEIYLSKSSDSDTLYCAFPVKSQKFTFKHDYIANLPSGVNYSKTLSKKRLKIRRKV